MPTTTLIIEPGIYSEATDKDAKNRWKDGEYVRWRNGLPENIGGWMRDNANTFAGICRGANNFVNLAGEAFITLGTHTNLYLWRGGSYYNITPLRDSTAAPFSSSQLNGPFSSTAASALITVHHVNHGAIAGDTVIFSSATASPTDGITINGSYLVTSVTDADHFVITHSVTATHTESNFGGAAVDYDYEINIGLADTTLFYGWSAGGWGNETWNTPRTLSSTSQLARIWVPDQWGEDLVANICDGPIYHWDATGGVTTRATIISGAPETAKYIRVSPEDRHLIAFGAHDGSDPDPLLVRWGDSESLDDFIPTAINTAGDKRLDRGKGIVGAIRTRGQILIYTDAAAYGMYITGDEFVYGFSTLGEGCGLISPHAIIENNGTVISMGEKNFCIFDGVMRVLPCDIYNEIYGDMNLSQKIKFHAGTNRKNNEALFFWCSKNSTEIDRGAFFDMQQHIWGKIPAPRTAWIDIAEGGGLEVPYATDPSGILYQHETGNDAGDDPLNSFIESYDIDIADGDQFMHIKKAFPDFKELEGSVKLTFKTRKYPQSSEATKGPVTVTSTTELINLRARARYIALRIDSNTKGDRWRMGNTVVHAFPNGRR